YENESLLIKDVANGKLVDGYVFKEKFEKNVLNGKTNDCITLYTSENAQYSAFTKEAVSAAVFEYSAPFVAFDFLEKDEELKGKQTFAQVKKNVKKYLDSENMMTIKVEVVGSGVSQNTKSNTEAVGGGTSQNIENNIDVGGESLAKQEKTQNKTNKAMGEISDNDSVFAGNLAKGFLAIFLLFFALVGAMLSAKDIKNGGINAFTLCQSKAKLLFFCMLPQLVLNCVFAGLSVGVIAFVLPVASQNIWYELFLVFALCISLFAVSYFMASFLKPETIAAFIPFIIIGFFVLSPVVFDVTAFLPVLKPIIYFVPTAQYLKSTQENFNMLFCTVFAPLIFIVPFFIFKFANLRKKRYNSIHK
ncbi:MAG: hypothetical protein RR052_00320, partial [Oscillospiraceae bacterium]